MHGLKPGKLKSRGLMRFHTDDLMTSSRRDQEDGMEKGGTAFFHVSESR